MENPIIKLRFFLSIGLAALSLVLYIPNGYSTTYLYTIPTTTFSDGGTISGSFIYNDPTDTFAYNSLTSVNVVTTNGTSLTGLNYTAGVFFGTYQGFQLFNPSIFDTNIQLFTKTSTGLLIDSIAEAKQNPDDSFTLRGSAVNINPVVIPEPSTYAILAGGLVIGSIVSLRRRVKIKD